MIDIASIALPAAAFEASAAGVAGGHGMPATVGFRPETDRYSSAASTRLSTRPDLTSSRAQRAEADAAVAQHLRLELLL